MSNADNFNPSEPLTGQNFVNFRAWIARKNGIGGGIFGEYDGSVIGYQNLDPDDKIRLTNLQNEWIRLNPTSASKIQLDVAKNKPIELTEKLTVGERVANSDVGSALITGADKLNELNPLSFFDSLGKIKWAIILGVAVIGGAWVYNKIKK